MLGVLVHIVADAGSSTFQVGNNPTTYLGGTGIVAVMGFVFRLATKIIERGDTRDARQWAQVELDMRRKEAEVDRVTRTKDSEIASLRSERDSYRDRWLAAIQQGKAQP